MSRQITVLLVDAFTETPGKGNRAGVVLDAMGLTADEMQAIAKLVNVSETAFMIPTLDRDDYSLEVRYFTPSTEVPICGHATIGSYFARCDALGLDDCSIVAKTGAGILPVDIVSVEGKRQIVMTQGAIVSTPEYDEQIRLEILTALGLGNDDVAVGLPVQEVSTGHSKVMVPIKSVQTLDNLSPDMAALSAVSGKINCNGFFVFAFNDELDSCLTSGRMFAPAIGIDEDPVTGNGNGPCGAYLSNHGVLPDVEKHTYRGRQGVAMGKEGVIDVTVHRRDGEVEMMQVGGTAVVAGSMEVSIVGNEDGQIVARTI